MTLTALKVAGTKGLCGYIYRVELANPNSMGTVHVRPPFSLLVTKGGLKKRGRRRGDGFRL